MLRAFFKTEAGSTSVLIIATVLGLVWANSPWGATYESFWHMRLGVSLGDAEFSLYLRAWVNDGLMTLFFFVIGLEMAREVTVGQLRELKFIAVPAVAAVGGVLVPALIYLALNWGGPGQGGWGVPIASDTAFVLGLLTAIGARCPIPLRAFVLTLAIVDDILAILVVAVFYTEDLSLPAMALAGALLCLIVALRWLKIWRAPAYLILGLGAWGATLASGVHPSVVGLALGALVLVYAPSEHKVLRAGEAVQEFTSDPNPQLARAAARSVRQAVSANERLQLMFHSWSSYVIVPIFALANAGVVLDSESLSQAATSPITIGVVLGLVAGKFIGIVAGTWLPLRLNWGVLPGNLVWGQLLGGAAVSGIGFTVSLFITDLAFDDPVIQSQLKIGIIAGSVIAAALSWLIFRMAWHRGGVCAPPTAEPEEELPEILSIPVHEGDHVLGPPDAPVTLVEYGDFECPYCGRLHEVLTKLRERHPDLRTVFRHFPIREIHPRAVPAAVIAEAAGDVGRFWEMHDLLYANQLRLTDADLEDYAARFGVEPWTDTAGHLARIEADRQSGLAGGARGTPTLFLNGIRYQGRQDLGALSQAVAALEAAPRVP
jgi:Na+/H+ antiporter NhaA